MKKYLVIFLFSASVFLTHYAFSGQAVYGDGIDYWAYLPSVYFDNDIDFTNQYRHLYTPENNNSLHPALSPEPQKTRITSIGKANNLHPPGTAILWSPAFLLADFISYLFDLPRNGYTNIYQIIVGLWSIFLVTIALYLIEQLVFKFIKNKGVSFLSASAIFFSSSLFYYGSYDILNSHFASFFLSTLTLYLLLVKSLTLKSTITIGSVIGLATLVRIQEALLLIPSLFYINNIFKKPHHKMLITILSWAIIISPLPFIWFFLYGIPVPEDYLNFAGRQYPVFGSLFHFTNGFFFRTPIILLSLLGIKLFYKKAPKVSVLFLSFFVPQFLLIASQGGWVAASYGGRMYISSLPFFAILLGFLLDFIRKKWGLKLAITIVVIFSLINIMSIASFVLFEKEVNSGKKRGLEEHTQEKLEQLLDTYLQKL